MNRAPMTSRRFAPALPAAVIGLALVAAEVIAPSVPPLGAVAWAGGVSGGGGGDLSATEPAHSEKARSSLVAEPAVIDLGEVDPGALHEGRATIRARDGEKKRVLWVQTSCGCASAGVGVREFAAGETTDLSVSLRAGTTPGQRIAQQVMVMAEGDAEPLVVPVVGRVAEPIATVVTAMTRAAGGGAEISVGLTATDGIAFRALRAVAGTTGLRQAARVDLRREDAPGDDPGLAQRFVLAVAPEADGRLPRAVSITLDHPRQKTAVVDLAAFATAGGTTLGLTDIARRLSAASAEMVTFPATKVGGSSSATVLLSGWREADGPPQIVSRHTEIAPSIAAVAYTAAGAEVEITLRLLSCAARAARERVVIESALVESSFEVLVLRSED